MTDAMTSHEPCTVASVASARHRVRHQSALPTTASAAAATAHVRRVARAKAGTPEADVAQVTSSRGCGSRLGGGAIEVPWSIAGNAAAHRAAAAPARSGRMWRAVHDAQRRAVPPRSRVRPGVERGPDGAAPPLPRAPRTAKDCEPPRTTRRRGPRADENRSSLAGA